MKLSHAVTIITVVSVAGFASAASPAHQHSHEAMTLDQVQSQLLPMSLKSVAAITQATKAGDKDAALRELAHLQAMLKQMQVVINKQIAPGFANTKCPIMGHPIDPRQVPDNLVREFQGKKIGFCCAGCPEQWDGLSDVQKEAKLKQHQAQAFINTACPIMGTPIDPDKVPSHLSREFRGQKVAFCCPGCPAQWDKLSDSQKQAKLIKVNTQAK
jgi:hypothetical protein